MHCGGGRGGGGNSSLLCHLERASDSRLMAGPSSKYSCFGFCRLLSSHLCPLPESILLHIQFCVLPGLPARSLPLPASPHPHLPPAFIPPNCALFLVTSLPRGKSSRSAEPPSRKGEDLPTGKRGGFSSFLLPASWAIRVPGMTPALRGQTTPQIAKQWGSATS